MAEPDDVPAVAPARGRDDLERQWLGEPDPVEVFSSEMTMALRQLRVEVAALRAERDGLRLEAEGLRVKLGAVQEQLGTRDQLDDAIRQLRLAVQHLGSAPMMPAPPRPPLAPPTTPIELTDRVIRWDAPLELVDDDGDHDVGEPTDDDARRRRSWPRRLLAAVAGAVLLLVVLGVLLASVGPLVLPYRTYYVRSGSMAPTIDEGALVVFTRADRDELGPRDIITFESPDGTRITHRIVDVDTVGGERVFVTQGDANAAPDPWRVRAAAARWVYAFDVPVLGSVFEVLADPVARVALLGVPALALLGLRLVDRRRSAPR